MDTITIIGVSVILLIAGIAGAIAGLKSEIVCDEKKKSSLETHDRITFEIMGNDYQDLKQFRKQHQNCGEGMIGDRFEYAFVPTSMGMLTTVSCSCGQKLSLGDILEFDSREYDENENAVLSKQDRINIKFEDEIRAILQMKNTRLFRIAFGKEPDFKTIYYYSLGIAHFADLRIRQSLLYEWSEDEEGIRINNYKDMNDGEKIEAFYRYFEKCIRVHLLKYKGDSDVNMIIKW